MKHEYIQSIGILYNVNIDTLYNKYNVYVTANLRNQIFPRILNPLSQELNSFKEKIIEAVIIPCFSPNIRSIQKKKDFLHIFKIMKRGNVVTV